MDPNHEMYSELKKSVDLDYNRNYISFYCLPETYNKDIVLIDYINNEKYEYINSALIKEYIHRDNCAVYQNKVVTFDKIKPILLINDINNMYKKDSGLLRRMKVIKFLE